MSTYDTDQNFKPVLTKRRLRWAGVAALISCAACCAAPLLAVAFASTGGAAAITGLLRPGSEVIVGGAVFAIVLGIFAVRSRIRPQHGCGPSCNVDRTCCADRG